MGNSESVIDDYEVRAREALEKSDFTKKEKCELAHHLYELKIRDVERRDKLFFYRAFAIVSLAVTFIFYLTFFYLVVLEKNLVAAVESIITAIYALTKSIHS